MLQRYLFTILICFLSFAVVGCTSTDIDDNALITDTLDSFERVIAPRILTAGGNSIEYSIEKVKPYAEEDCYNVPSS